MDVFRIIAAPSCMATGYGMTAYVSNSSLL